ncbi:hypothetical protein PR202_ga16212 [Eleusine coracana subsp. coracana]|uniref:Uncharacterized protein n=1 Tax=Eleusine coracana subsp. coracana TaxID=191504 RepID=A0AAV5CM83_ELECO|nr:hypothetical protein PR202_ga16212 [Eleusine coracana subsp. coracana]
MQKVCVYALTEPDHGSDASSMSTKARKVPGGWILNGQKRWPANSSFADVFVVLAQNTVTNQVNGFIVNSGSPGLKALSVARIMVAWVAIGVAMGAYDTCLRYLMERKQFGAPLAAFQLNQGEARQDAGKHPGHAWITKTARETVALGRELLGGNGIVTDFHVGKAFCDMESVYSYEGSYDVNALIVAREVTGISSIRPASRL